MSKQDRVEDVVGRTFLVSADVVKASGGQTWKVRAKTEEEAVEMVSKGGGDFFEEEIEVTELGEFYNTGELDPDEDEEKRPESKELRLGSMVYAVVTFVDADSGQVHSAILHGKIDAVTIFRSSRVPSCTNRVVRLDDGYTISAELVGDTVEEAIYLYHRHLKKEMVRIGWLREQHPWDGDTEE